MKGLDAWLNFKIIIQLTIRSTGNLRTGSMICIIFIISWKEACKICGHEETGNGGPFS